MKFLLASALIFSTSSALAKFLSFDCSANGMHPWIVNGNTTRELRGNYENGRTSYRGRISKGEQLLLGNEWSVAGNYGGYLKSATVYLDSGRILSVDHIEGRVSEIQEGEHLYYGLWGNHRDIKCNFILN